MGKFLPGNPGRKPGSKNKSTANAREAIATFVDGNADRMQEWLDKIANGIPKRDAQGLNMLDKEGRQLWEVPPNPEKAFSLFQSVIEYHVPKLGRQELTGADGAGLTIQIVKLSDTPKLTGPAS